MQEGSSKDSDSSSKLMLESLRGNAITAIEQWAEGVWAFSFTSGCLTIECPWRVLREKSVLLGSADHGQKFGLPAPVDAASEIMRIFDGKAVAAVEVNCTADLRVSFGENIAIEAFNYSGGYEGWNYSDHSGVNVVALGGGGLAIWGKLPSKPD